MSKRNFFTSTALTALGMVVFATPGVAKDVGDFDVWEFENTAAVERSEGYVRYEGDRIVDNLTQEDIGRLGHVDLRANLTIATGVESGPMHILGKLTSTGQVFVLDVNGFLFGQNSVVDTAGFAALGGTATNLSTYEIDNRLDVAISEDAKIDILEGAQVTVADAGLAAFVAPTVTNAGLIRAKMGKVVVGSAEKATIDMYGDGLFEIVLNGEASKAVINNTGTISAEGGDIIVTASAAKDAVENVINMDGIVSAASATVKGGKIVLGGPNTTVKVKGKIDASGTDGGEIEIDAQNTFTSAQSEIKADGQADGSAGRIVMWGRENALYTGDVSALGQNGFIETSGGKLGVWGDVFLSAGGEWLLDPTDITIVNGDLNSALFPASPPDVFFSPNDSGPTPATPNADSWVWIGDDNINAALDNDVNVTLRTFDEGTRQGDITVRSDAEIVKSVGTNSTLTLEAHDDIIINGIIRADAANGARLNVELIADYDISGNGGPGGTADIDINNSIDTNGGSFTASAPGTFSLNASGSMNLGSGTATINTPTVNLANDINTTGMISGIANMVNIQNTAAQIQDGVDVAASGGTVNVADGTYIENIRLNKALTLLSENGRDSTTIQGIPSVGALGTVQFLTNTSGVQLGDTDKGFTIIGIDNDTPGIENAAVYMQGNQSNHIIKGNDIVANGDSGLTSEFAGTVTNITIESNIFSGTTFTGANPAGIGFGSQFSTPNVPRQLVVMGGGTGGGNTSDITFKNNNITGTAGGISTDDGVTPQGNTLVTIDADNSEITGNTFNGTTTSFGASLRARGDGTLISGNTFHAAGLTDTNAHVFVTDNVYAGVTDQDDILDIWNTNTFVGRATVTSDDVFPIFDSVGLTIQGAVSASNPNATVYVNDAVYKESVLVDRALTILGSGPTNTTTLEVADNSAGFTVTSSDVQIDGFRFERDGNASNTRGIILDGRSTENGAINNILIGDTALDADMIGNYFVDELSIGVLARGDVDNVTITDNTFGLMNSDDRISQGIVTRVERSGSSVVDGAGNILDGDDIGPLSDWTIEDNDFYVRTSGKRAAMNLEGISGTAADGFVIRGNTTYDATYGLLIVPTGGNGSGAPYPVTKNLLIDGNTINGRNGGGTGIRIGGNDDSISPGNDRFRMSDINLTGNVINNTGTGIHVTGVGGARMSDVTFNGNIINSADDYGIRLNLAGVSNNKVNPGEPDYTGFVFTNNDVNMDATGTGLEIISRPSSEIEIGTGNSFDAGEHGITISGNSGQTITLVGNTLNNTVFTNQSGDYIRLSNTALFDPGQPTIIDATGVTFDALDPANTALDAIALEGKVQHYLDNPALGLLDYGAIVAGDSIQLAVNAAGLLNDDTVYVGGRTAAYGGSVEVWVDDLTVQGVEVGGEDAMIDVATMDAHSNYGLVNQNAGLIVSNTTGYNGNAVSNVTGVTVGPVTFSGAGNGITLGSANSTAIDTTVDSNIFDVTGEAVILSNIDGKTDITNNNITGGITGINVTDTLNGDLLNITNNIIGIDTDEVEKGILFSNINIGSVVNISQGSVNTSSLASGPADGDGIHFAEGLDDGATVNIFDIAVTSDRDDAVDFNRPVDSGATVNIYDGTFTGGNNGLEFTTIAGTVNIGKTGDTTVIEGQGVNHRGVNLLSAVTGSVIVTDSTVTGGDDGIGGNTAQNNSINGGTFRVTNSTVTGINGDGIELGAISNSATVDISNNIKIDGGAAAIHFVDGIDNSTVDVNRNTLIEGTDGIRYGGVLLASGLTGSISGNSVVNVNNNVDVVTTGTGIRVESDVMDSAAVEISHNRIDADGDGIAFDGGTSNVSKALHDIYLHNNTVTGGDNGVIFAGIASGANHDIHITQNDIEGEGVDGIAHTGGIDGALLEITRNTALEANFDAIFVNGSLSNNAGVRINNNRNISTSAGNGINIIDTADSRGANLDIRQNAVQSAGSNGIRVENVRNAQIINNNVLSADDDGIDVERSRDANIRRNTITFTQGDGIDVTRSRSADIINNNVFFASEDGIEVRRSRDVNIRRNTVGIAGDDGIDVERSRGADIINNIIGLTLEDGIKVDRSRNAVIRRNIIALTGDDGIDVERSRGAQIINNTTFITIGDGIEVRRSRDVNIRRNTITFTGDDGIDVRRSNGADVINNTINFAGDDGIYARRSDGLRINRNTVTTTVNDGIDAEFVNNGVINGNIITDAGQHGIAVNESDLMTLNGNTVTGSDIAGIFVTPSTNITLTGNTTRGNDIGIFMNDVTIGRVEGNTVDNNITTGMQVENSDQVRILDNDIFENGSVGLYAAGAGNGLIEVSENRFTDNPVHASFESGLIDLTGTGNRFIDGDVGLRFSPFGGNGALLSLVDDDAPGSDALGAPLPYGNYGGTIGAQFFSGQDDFFVELQNNAFFSPGNPTILNATESTFDTPFGLIRPADTNSILDINELAFLENSFNHFVDDTSLGLFFFGFIPELLDQNDFVRLLNVANLEVTGLNIRILGLPNIPGAPATFANIEPFAGGADGEATPTTAEALNALITEAGDETQEVNCWGDATNMATAGQSATISYGQGAEDILSGAASCASDI